MAVDLLPWHKCLCGDAKLCVTGMASGCAYMCQTHLDALPAQVRVVEVVCGPGGGRPGADQLGWWESYFYLPLWLADCVLPPQWQVLWP